MEINGTNTVDSSEIQNLYQGRLNRKERFIEYLERDGYRFVASNNRNLDMTKKWSQNDPVMVASSCTNKPLFLWAVRPVDGVTNGN